MPKRSSPRFYLNILDTDSGFAPNPFHGWCTLACCRPVIRRVAQEGDWVIGITPKELGNDIAYMMRVDETPTFAKYFDDVRFKVKQPRFDTGWFVDTLGDNCYRPRSSRPLRSWRSVDEYDQLKCVHYDWDNDCESTKLKKWDLSTDRVLVSHHFSYFGLPPKALAKKLYESVIPARYNRVHFLPHEYERLVALASTKPVGCVGRPRDWEGQDSSWRLRGRCG